MNLSQAVAGRSRNVEAPRAFLRPGYDSSTQGASLSSLLPWKPAIFGRIRAAFRGPQHHVMEALVRLSGPDARCWVSMATLSREARVDVKTARKHVHALVKVGGFLRTDAMTWAQLCAERRAAGRPVPRTDNDRNAPYLFTVLDGVGRRASELPEAERRQRFSTRWGQPPRRAQGNHLRVNPEPQTRDLVTHEGYQIWEARGLPNLVPDLSDDPLDHREVSVLVPQDGTSDQTHTVLVESSKGELWLIAWQSLLDAYGKHFRRVYQASPKTPRRLKPDDPKEAGEYLAEKACVLADRLTLSKQEAVRSLADRTLAIWLDRKGTGDFLERESHPLWALCSELPARVNEAFKALVREHAPPTVQKAPEKVEKPAASWAEIDAARRQAEQELSKIFGAPLKPISRLNAQPKLEKPVTVSRPEIRPNASSPSNETVKAEKPRIDRPATMPERPKAPAPPLRPRRNEALPMNPRPESVRSGPRWGESGPRPARMRHTRAMELAVREAEPDEPDPIE